MLKRTKVGSILIAVFAGAGLALPVWTPARSSAACLSDIEGTLTYGGLGNNASVVLKLDDINESKWRGNLAYNAKRFYSNGSESFSEYVESGDLSYGTSGNVSRRTGIQRGGYSTMTEWYVQQWQIC